MEQCFGKWIPGNKKCLNCKDSSKCRLTLARKEVAVSWHEKCSKEKTSKTKRK